MVENVGGFGQVFNYGQFSTGQNRQTTGPSNPGGTDQAGAGSLRGTSTPPPPEALAGALKAALKEMMPRSSGPASANASEAQAEHLESIMSSAVSGDTATYLARAMLKFYSEQRHDAVLDRQMLGLEAQGAMMASAAQIDKEADKLQTAAVVSLVTTCVASSITIAASATSAVMKGISLGKEVKAMTSEMAATKELGAEKGLLANVKDFKAIEGDPTLLEDLSTAEGSAENRVAGAESKVIAAKMQGKEAEKLANIGGAIGQIGDASGKVIASAGDFNAKMTDADVKHMEAGSKRLDALAENFRTQADAKKAIVDALDDMIHQVLSFVKDMADAKADRMHSIIHG